MPIRIPHHHVTIHRDGKNISPKMGQPFDFTQEEIDDLTAGHENALRRPINEGRPNAETAPRRQPAVPGAGLNRPTPVPAAEVTSDNDELVDDDGDPATPPVARRAATAKTPARIAPAKTPSPAPADAEDDDAL